MNYVHNGRYKSECKGVNLTLSSLKTKPPPATLGKKPTIKLSLRANIVLHPVDAVNVANSMQFRGVEPNLLDQFIVGLTLSCPDNMIVMKMEIVLKYE